MQPLEYICLGFCICPATIFALYCGSVVFLDWYNRVYLPKQPPELITDQDGDVMSISWVYSVEKKIAERVATRRDSPTVFCGTAPPVGTGVVGTRLPPQTYDDKGNLKP